MSDAPQTQGPGALPQSGGYAGVAGFQTPGSDYAAFDLMMRQIMAGQAQPAVVKVLSVSGGGLSAPARVSVQNMVDQVGGLGNRTPHCEIFDLPCFRYQAGTAAVILDPVVDDIGLAIICGRDISAVKNTGSISAPGSSRQNSWSDGCYLGGFLNGIVDNYIQFSGSGISIISGGTININAGGGTVIDGKPFLPHHHSGVQTGGGNTGPVS